MLIELLLLINLARPTPLYWSPELAILATERAEIVYKTEWSHKGFQETAKKATCTYVGENLAQGFTSVEEMHQAFMDSPAHKALITDKYFRSVGIGTYEDVTVELFCNI